MIHDYGFMVLGIKVCFKENIKISLLEYSKNQNKS